MVESVMRRFSKDRLFISLSYIGLGTATINTKQSKNKIIKIQFN